MPKFVVTKKVDAYTIYETIVDAENAEAARDEAAAYDYPGEWVDTCRVDEFDATDIFLEDVRLFEDGEPEKIDAAYVLTVSDAEHATIIAALRVLQQRVEAADLSPLLLDIATNGGEHELLTGSEIDDLCERIN